MRVYVKIYWLQLTCMLMQVSSSLQENGIEVREYDAVSSDVAVLASNQLDLNTVVNSGRNGVRENDTYEAEENYSNLIWVDPASCCYALFSKLDADKVVLQQSPLALAKALKVVSVFPIWLNLTLEAHKIYLCDVSSGTLETFMLCS